jgi:DNA-binding HxlR family transcriptional regulator
MVGTGDFRTQPAAAPARCPRWVEYTLTELGQTLVEPIEVLNAWAREHGAAIADFQEAAETATPEARAAG